MAIVDRGYRGKSKVGETEIINPKKPKKMQHHMKRTKQGNVLEEELE